MDPEWLLLLSLAVFGAAMLQAATGIGYGVIAGPIFLVVFNGGEAIQISTLHNFIIAVSLFPWLRAGIVGAVLKPLALGAALGIAVGFGLQAMASVLVLKLVAAGMVIFVAGSLFVDLRQRRVPGVGPEPAPGQAASVGGLAGVMGGMLAMPGPLAAAWMSIRGYDKAAVRATILGFFVFAYGVNILVYLTVFGFDAEALRLTGIMVPPLMLGILAGAFMARRLSERLFRWILLGVLVATVVILLGSLLPTG